MDSCWVVYTNDVRFPTTRIDSVFTNEKAAEERAAFLNAEDAANGTSTAVRMSHATRFNLRTEMFTD